MDEQPFADIIGSLEIHYRDKQDEQDGQRVSSGDIGIAVQPEIIKDKTKSSCAGQGYISVRGNVFYEYIQDRKTKDKKDEKGQSYG